MAVYWISFALFAAAALLGLIYMRGLVIRQQEEVQSLKQELRALSGNLSALCTSSAGMDRRLGTLESGERDRKEREERTAQRQKSQTPYGEAIYLVHQGASAQRLVDELGLSYSEAELVCRVHGVKSGSECH